MHDSIQQQGLKVEIGTGLLTTQQSADYIGCTARMLQARRIRGGGPQYVRLSSRMVRYRPEDLQAWIGERIKTSTSER